jgi:hypothetical protein
MKNPTSWDEYEIKARYIPCFLTAIPPAHFLIQFLGTSFWEELARNIGWLLVANISLSLIVTLALIQLQTGIAKHWIEESVFGKGGINFPTTSLLLFNNPILSRSMKVAIREKVFMDFNFKLMDEIQESADKQEAARLIREAVGFIRGRVRKGLMTYQYNIRYGFMRNLTGGALWACAGSIGSGFIYGIQKNWAPLAFFVSSAVLFCSVLIFKKQILQKFAFQYAETLFSEYLTLRGDVK